jgi:hypothetical protein
MILSAASRSILLQISILAWAVAPTIAHAESPIQVVDATFGRPSETRPHNFSGRLQQLCGESTSYCEAFCSEAIIGSARSGFSLPFTARPICRIIYRCGSEATQAFEADKGELIVLNCRKGFVRPGAP